MIKIENKIKNYIDCIEYIQSNIIMSYSIDYSTITIIDDSNNTVIIDLQLFKTVIRQCIRRNIVVNTSKDILANIFYLIENITNKDIICFDKYIYTHYSDTLNNEYSIVRWLGAYDKSESLLDSFIYEMSMSGCQSAELVQNKQSLLRQSSIGLILECNIVAIYDEDCYSVYDEDHNFVDCMRNAQSYDKLSDLTDNMDVYNYYKYPELIISDKKVTGIAVKGYISEKTWIMLSEISDITGLEIIEYENKRL